MQAFCGPVLTDTVLFFGPSPPNAVAHNGKLRLLIGGIIFARPPSIRCRWSLRRRDQPAI